MDARAGLTSVRIEVPRMSFVSRSALPSASTYTPPVGAQLLTLFGVPCLWQVGPPTVIRFKYRRTVAVLGYVLAHPGREVGRQALADLLWPQLAADKARANLRLVLADWAQGWRLVSSTPLLEVSRDTLVYRPSPHVMTDLEWLGRDDKKPLNACWDSEAVCAQCSRAGWLDGVDEGLSDNFLDWLCAQRQSLAPLLQRTCQGADARWTQAQPLPTAAEAQQNGLKKYDAKKDVPLFYKAEDAIKNINNIGAFDPASPSQELAVLALFKFERGLDNTDWLDAGADSDWHRALDHLTHQLTLLGGHRLSGDDSACTFVFGLTSEHTGCRWQALQAAAKTWAWVGAGAPLRMGVTAGRMLIRQGPRLAVLGWRLRLLDRLTLYADDGELVCCDAFAELAEHNGARTVHGVAFRGFDRPFDLHVLPLASLACSLLPHGGGALEGRFVGRQAALNVAAQALSRAAAGHATSLTVQAPPGWGKTRLAGEVALNAQRQGCKVVWLSGRPETRAIPWCCLADGLAALFVGEGGLSVALADWQRANGGVLTPAGLAAVRSLLQNRSVAHAARADLIIALAALLRPPLQAGATVCVIDDLHWVDDASIEAINRVATVTNGLMWLVTVRSEAPLPRAFQQQPGADHQHIDLTPLDDAAARELVRALPGGAHLDDVSLQGRLAQAQGVPLYLLADLGAGVDGNPHFGEFCNAMLNRLRGHRPVLQTAATLGMRFATADLRELCDAVGEPGTVDRALEQALAAGLLVTRGPSHVEFFHPRLHEYLLSTLTGVALRHASARCATLLEARGEHVGAAELWLQAQDTPAAQRCWHAAATQAARNDDLVAAIHAFERLAALGYLPGAPGVEARAIHVRCLLARNGYGSPEAHQITQTLATVLPDPVEHPDLAFDVLSLAYLNASSQSHEAALAVGRQMIETAHSPAAHHTACWAMANALFWIGEFDEARIWFARMADSGAALSLSQRMRYFPSDPMVFGQHQLAWMEWLCGHEAGLRQAQQLAADHASQTTTRQDHAIHHVFGALLSWLQGQFGTAHAQATQALDVAETEGLVFWQAQATLMQALAAAEQGQQVDFAGLAKWADHVQTHYPSAVVVALWLGSAALVASGQNAMALSVIGGTLEMAGDTGHGTCRADLLRLKGVALQALGEPDAAHLAHQQALRCARQAGLAGWKVRWAG